MKLFMAMSHGTTYIIGLQYAVKMLAPLHDPCGILHARDLLLEYFPFINSMASSNFHTKGLPYHTS